MAILFTDGQALSATQLNAAFTAKMDATGDATNLTSLAGSGPTARTMTARFSDTINVLDFLTAVPDGATNNTTQLQSAINTAAGKARVYFPAVTNPYSVSGLTIPANSHITLDGTILLRTSSTNSVFRVLNSATNVTIDGTGTIDGNKSNQSAAKHGIETNTATAVNVYDLIIQNCYLSPFSFSATTDTVIDNCVLKTNNKAATIMGASTNVWLRNTVVSSISDSGILFYGGVSNSGVIGCIINATTNGVYVFHDTTSSAACHDLIITNNVCYGNTAWGILIDKGTGAVGNHSNIQVSHNRTYGNNTANVTGIGGIKNNSGTNVLIMTNQISKNGNGTNASYGVAVAASNTHVFGNQIVDEGQGSVLGVGVFLANTANNVIISNNQIIDDQATKTMKYGISGAAGTNVRLLNNATVGMITAVSNLTAAADTVGIDSSSATTIITGPLAATGPLCDQSTATATPVTGFATTIPNGCSTYLMTPAGTLATGALTMPATPITGQLLRILSTQTITSFSLLANTGQTIMAAPSSAAFNANTALSYVLSGTVWYRVSDSAGGTATTGPLAVRTVTAAGAITATLTDDVIIINKTIGAATTVALPSSPPLGFILTIKDAKGDAATNTITITAAGGTIDGAANVVLNSNFDSVDLIYSATNVWNVY